MKIGQTLSQRPDLIGEEAADALKSLQMDNEPFPDHLAFEARTIADDLSSTDRARAQPSHRVDVRRPGREAAV